MGQSLARHRCEISELLEAASVGNAEFIRKVIRPCLLAAIVS